jgi:hypothetical protein
LSLFFGVLFLPLFLIFFTALVSHYASPFPVVQNIFWQRGFLWQPQLAHPYSQSGIFFNIRQWPLSVGIVFNEDLSTQPPSPIRLGCPLPLGFVYGRAAILLKQIHDLRVPALALGASMSAAEQPGFWQATEGKGEYALVSLVNAGNAPSRAAPWTREGAVGTIFQWQKAKRVVVYPFSIAAGEVRLPPGLNRR